MTRNLAQMATRNQPWPPISLTSPSASGDVSSYLISAFSCTLASCSYQIGAAGRSGPYAKQLRRQRKHAHQVVRQRMQQQVMSIGV